MASGLRNQWVHLQPLYHYIYLIYVKRSGHYRNRNEGEEQIYVEDGEEENVRRKMNMQKRVKKNKISKSILQNIMQQYTLKPLSYN
jgi:hypothetical protein